MDLLQRSNIEIHKVCFGEPSTLTESRRSMLMGPSHTLTKKDLPVTCDSPKPNTDVARVAMFSAISGKGRRRNFFA
jgi:hypothetical protein